MEEVKSEPCRFLRGDVLGRETSTCKGLGVEALQAFSRNSRRPEWLEGTE